MPKFVCVVLVHLFYHDRACERCLHLWVIVDLMFQRNMLIWKTRGCQVDELWKIVIRSWWQDGMNVWSCAVWSCSKPQILGFGRSDVSNFVSFSIFLVMFSIAMAVRLFSEWSRPRSSNWPQTSWFGGSLVRCERDVVLFKSIGRHRSVQKDRRWRMQNQDVGGAK